MGLHRGEAEWVIHFGAPPRLQESPVNLDRWLVELNNELKVGMQVLEDSLCNWQKSPEKFKPFRG